MESFARRVAPSPPTRPTPESSGPRRAAHTSLLSGPYSTGEQDLHTPVITFLSDYGHDDDFVGVCHGVMAKIAPHARVIDLSHGIRRHDVLAGAIVLRNALHYLPVGVHLAVVDPGVGSERRAVALALADGRRLVGPDNGLLSLAAGDGVLEAADIGRSPFRLEPVSSTFHGRDIFAPVAARLAQGATLADAGEPLDPGELSGIELPAPIRDGEAVIAHVIYVDGFGNVGLDLSRADLPAVAVTVGTDTATLARTFADAQPGALILYEDAYRTLALAVNRGDAAARLGLAAGDQVRIAPA